MTLSQQRLHGHCMSMPPFPSGNANQSCRHTFMGADVDTPVVPISFTTCRVSDCLSCTVTAWAKVMPVIQSKLQYSQPFSPWTTYPPVASDVCPAALEASSSD